MVATYVGSEIETAIDELIGGAPAALDTLNELAAALNDDENRAVAVDDALAGKLDIGQFGFGGTSDTGVEDLDSLPATGVYRFDTASENRPFSYGTVWMHRRSSNEETPNCCIH